MSVAIDDLSASLDAVGGLVAGVRDDQWAVPTPCTEWNVRELVNHLVLGSRLYVDILRGVAPAMRPGILNPDAGDALGDEPATAYRRAAAELVAEFRQPGALDRVIEVPVGAIPGVAAAQLRTVEELVHGWDLARAIGVLPAFPDDVVERAFAFTRGQLADLPAEGSPFAPPRSVSADAGPLDQLVALVGRTPTPA